MIGTYRFYEGGVLVGEQKNLLTTEGKRSILSYLAGYNGNFAAEIALGVFDTAATVSDKQLAMEWTRVPILTISPDYINTLLVYKGRLDAAAAGKIYEAGIISGSNGAVDNSQTISDFTSALGIWSAGTFDSTTSRVGGESLRLAPAASSTQTATLSDLFIDLSEYSINDEFRLAYSPNNAFTSSVVLRLKTDVSNYFTRTISTPASGYKLNTFTKANFVSTGTPDWSNITAIEVAVTSTAGGAAQVDFDALRIVDTDNLTSDNILVSRAVLGSPVVKNAGLPLDIEYTLDVTL